SIARPRVQRADLDTGIVDRDDDHRNPPMASAIWIGAYAEPLVGGALSPTVPDLGAVDDPFLAVARGTSTQVSQVGSGFRLGIADSAHHFTLGDEWQPFGFVLFGAMPHDHRRH